VRRCREGSKAGNRDSKCPETLPFNFGEYSPRTLGITVNLPLDLDERLKDIFLYLTADSKEQLQGFRMLFRDASEEERFLILGYASAVAHELRHFHDYLLSPIGVMDGGDFAMAAINLLPAMIVLRQEETWRRSSRATRLFIWT
jgi:hypothetical protein